MSGVSAATWTLDLSPEVDWCCWPSPRTRMYLDAKGVCHKWKRSRTLQEAAETRVRLSDRIMSAVAQNKHLYRATLIEAGVDLQKLTWKNLAPTWGQITRIEQALARMRLRSEIQKGYQADDLDF